MAANYGSGSAWKVRSHIAKGSKGPSGSQDSLAKHRGMKRSRPKTEG